jgi:hypothetical protein
VHTNLTSPGRALLWCVILTATASSLAACSEEPKAPTGAAVPVPTSQIAQKQDAPVRCNGDELISCEFPPLRDLSAACDYLRRHVIGLQVGDETIQGISSCDAPSVSTPSQFGSVAAVAARLEVDGPPSHGAFLFARLDDDWRLVDQLLDPAWTHGGFCEVRFRMRWEGKERTFDATLDTLSERVCRMSLDREELSARESDIASRECRHARYGLAAKRLSRLSREESDEPCRID